MTFTPDDLAALKQQVRLDEGLRLMPYTDTVGKLTIGFGHNLTDKGLTKAQADQILEDDIEDAMSGVLNALPWTQALDARRLSVIVNIAFNAGVSGLLGFHKMLAAAKAGDFETAATEIEQSQLAPRRAARLAVLMRG